MTAAREQPANRLGESGGQILVARGLDKRFGALRVLEDVMVELEQGVALGIVGPNGAGKTTLLDILAGATRPDGGSVTFQGKDVTTLGAAARCRLGIARTHQIPRPFSGMTVFENALVAAMMGAQRREGPARASALQALERTGMLGVANRRAATLGLLDRKRLELARALATGPSLLLLDEIAGGLTEPETVELVAQIARLHADGLTVVWIEHVVHALLRVAGRLMCLFGGVVIADGEPQRVMADPAVIDAYLGSAA